MSQEPRYQIFVLGAGFSCAAGLPVGAELWRLVQALATGRTGRAGRFDSDLETYIRFRRECDRVQIEPEQIDFEDFLAFLDLEHYLGLAGSDTWSSEGNESQVLIKALIGQILVECTPLGDALPQIYRDFAEQLRCGDYVFTFNYDNVLERALDHVGCRYRLFPTRYEENQSHGAVVDSSSDEVVVLKLHGSVDWFDRTLYSQMEERYAEARLNESPDHPIFGPNSVVQAKPILDEPQFPDDSLLSVYRVTSGLEHLYRDFPFFVVTPCLVSPSKIKAVYASRFKSFWEAMGQAGVINFGMCIIGYSLSSHDDYTKQVLFRMLRNYQDNWWDQEVFGGQRESGVILVDLRDDAEGRRDLLARFGFIEPEKATFHFSGFDDQAVGLTRAVF